MISAIDPKDILIRTLPTPNPFALKFVINSSLKDDGKASFNAPEECVDLPLVRDLFLINGVKQVHLFQNTLTVTHSDEVDSETVSEQVSAVIRTRLPLHDPAFGEAAPKPRVRAETSNPVVQSIEEILDRTIRPGLQADGGDIEIISYENDELRIVYQGACGGCPSSMAGTLDAIQGILRNELSDEKLMVVPV